ncbi:MAG: hypothetical protein OXG53_12790 [Chloroflexi bacterium]|nr:hypothetical protein [Chloroflexota bacterium]
MRHDWTPLCTEVHTHDTGAIGLENVFSTLLITSPYGSAGHAESFLFDPPAILVSHWTAEFAAERRLHSATVQQMAPGGDRVLWADNLEFDFRFQTSYFMTLILQDMQLTGVGTYEFHVLLEEFALFGEWGRASLTISEA